MSNYCNNCQTKECNYICTKIMMDALKKEGNYEFMGCPDKESPLEAQKLLQELNPNRKPYILPDSKHCTADIRMINEQNEEVYLEVKRIPFAYEHDKEIGNSKSIDLIMFLISEIFETYDQHADFIRENYTIFIKSGHIQEFDKKNFYIEDYIQDNFETIQNNEITLFIEEFVNYIYDNYTNLGEFKFNRSRDPIIIKFELGIPFVKDHENFNTSSKFNLVNADINLNNINVLQFLILFNRFYFALPAINLNDKTINMNKFLETLTCSTPIVNQVIKNLDKSKNSFYGIDSNRYVIQELFYKYNNDELFIDDNKSINEIGQVLFNNLSSELKTREEEISIFRDFFDKCLLFIPLSNNSTFILTLF